MSFIQMINMIDTLSVGRKTTIKGLSIIHKSGTYIRVMHIECIRSATESDLTQRF